MSEYSLSLFILGQEENLLGVFYDEIKCLLNIFKDEEVIDFFQNKFIKKEEKKNFISNNLKEINEYLINFIKIIVDDNKEDWLVEILEKFINIYNKENNIINGIVYGMEKDISKIRKIENIFSDRLGKKVLLEFKQDISLIGGYKVIIDNNLYDNSFKYRLNKLKDKLLEEGEYLD